MFPMFLQIRDWNADTLFKHNIGQVTRVKTVLDSIKMPQIKQPSMLLSSAGS